MSFRLCGPSQFFLRASCLLAASALLVACNRDEPRVYHIPKDSSAPPPEVAPASAPAPAVADSAPTQDVSGAKSGMNFQSEFTMLPHVVYKLPAGWQEKPPSEMRVASFSATGSHGQTADIGVVPLPVVGRDLELVNMWREQVQLPPTSDPSAAQHAETVPVGNGQGRLFEFVSEKPMAGKSRQRILVAMLTRDTMSWFFKMAGDDEFVSSQKENFLRFLKSVSFDETASDDMKRGSNLVATTAQVDSGDAKGTIWNVPSGWKPVPPSQFLLAEYSVSGSNGAKAEVNVAQMAGGGGGLLANVNRWRGQLGLAALDEKNFGSATEFEDKPGTTATFVDFTGVDAKTNAPTRLVGAIVQQGDQTWFYKMMGDKETVAQQKDAFRRFVGSANYANAH